MLSYRQYIKHKPYKMSGVFHYSYIGQIICLCMSNSCPVWPGLWLSRLSKLPHKKADW